MRSEATTSALKVRSLLCICFVCFHSYLLLEPCIFEVLDDSLTVIFSYEARNEEGSECSVVAVVIIFECSVAARLHC